MSSILPFKIVYQEGNEEKSLLSPNMKNALSLARPMAKKGIAIKGLVWDNNAGWYVNPDFQRALNLLPIQGEAKDKKAGSHERYNALVQLGVLSKKLSTIALKRALTTEETTDLTVCMGDVAFQFGIDLSEMTEGEE